MQVSHVAQSKHVYILKKKNVLINSENYKDVLLFGLVSPPPLLQLSCTVEQVIVIPFVIHIVISFVLPCIFAFRFLSMFLHQICVPLLTNKENHLTWSNLMAEDIVHHVESMCSKTAVVRGQISGKTVLPMSNAADWMEKSYYALGM